MAHVLAGVDGRGEARERIGCAGWTGWVYDWRMCRWCKGSLVRSLGSRGDPYLRSQSPVRLLVPGLAAATPGFVEFALEQAHGAAGSAGDRGGIIDRLVGLLALLGSLPAIQGRGVEDALDQGLGVPPVGDVVGVGETVHAVHFDGVW